MRPQESQREGHVTQHEPPPCVHELELGARLARQGICGPIWVDGDDEQIAKVRTTRSWGGGEGFEVACAGAAAMR